MNRIYSLRYCSRFNSVIPVPEFCHRRTKSSVKTWQAGLLLTLLSTCSPLVYASVVSSEIPYQTFRDFAENKGEFSPGAINVPIYKKNGSIAGTLNKASMPDFSSANFGTAVATLISPQYIASVKHNGGYKGVSFGNSQNYYNIVNRNNHPSLDFHIPRLNKIVTEVAPADVTSAGTGRGIYSNQRRFPVFYRLGSGVQMTRNLNGQLNGITRGYRFLTGGTMGAPSGSDWSYWSIVNHPGLTFDPANGPLASYGLAGDSGSPVFTWDADKNKWVILGVYSGYSGIEGVTSRFTIIPVDFTERIKQENDDAPVTFMQGSAPLRWTFNASNGGGSLKEGNNAFEMHGQKGDNPDAGKNLTFYGENGNILLQDSVDQGAGTLTFNNSYTLSSVANETWKGGGIDISRDAVVTWKINGIKGDNLHKVGTGTLKVNGTGINEGGLKVGDGTVVLSQRPDENNSVQAFSSVDIASGRPTVVLSDNRQVNPDTISWGFRGGVLDINGNDIDFHKIIKAADNGAVITNTSPTTSLVTISPVTDLPDINDKDVNKDSGGKKGLLYKYENNFRHTVDYFIQKKDKYKYDFPANHTSNFEWEYVGHDELSAKKLVQSRWPKDNLLFHGNLTGNLNVRTDSSGSTGDMMAFDGNIDIPQGTFSRSGGRLTFQGHPVIHAYNSKEIADKLKSLGDDSVRTQPVSFEQSDWETRAFILKQLTLDNTDFKLSRNTVMVGDINANHSGVTLGSPLLWIDLNDGNGTKAVLREGRSVASDEPDMSEYHGNVTLNNQSTLDIREKFSGSITASNSSVSVTSAQAFLNEYSMFRNTPLVLQNGARMIARGGFWSDVPVIINPGARMTLSAAPGSVVPGSYVPAEYRIPSWTLSGPGAGLEIRPWTYVTGNIHASDTADISVGNDTVDAGPDKSLPFYSWLLSARLRDYRNVWQGRVDAEHGRMSVMSTDWKMNGNSRVHDLKIADSRVSFGGSGFTHLTVDTLNSTQSSFVLRTDLKNSDKITVRQHAEGSVNTLFVNYLRQPSGKDALNIPLVSAPAGTDPAMFKAAERTTGFSRVAPHIRTEEKDGVTRWVLDGFDVAPNKNVTRSANSFLGTGKQNFLTEVNNLNKRMGDLRDTQGDDGLWVRVMNGAGSGDAGYSDRYTHFQFGFDKKHRLDGADLFTGVLMSHTDSHAGSSAFTGESRSLGGGVYTSLMLDSGAYVDVIGKYVHHDNNYTARFIGPGKQGYGTHSWYAGMEAGYRYRLSADMYIEPQAELVYGAVSGSRFRWSADGMDMSMTNKHYNPLTGRTGVAFGKIFTGKEWQVTARAGVDYQFDLVSNGETALRDATGEHRFTGEKDSRMLYNIGVNAQLKDNVRFGVELEQSAFGKYNVDHLINANLRYMF
ncbi:TPA: autotransporter outer membrane beta-barrel domain-containing protein [Salmonella enterica subsp. enterica serovar Typhimurium]|nr:autotransporter outer membrane beta-barrel domain-containing protein [Salmonella enterica subsp. enterica serovar Typhimurium]